MRGMMEKRTASEEEEGMKSSLRLSVYYQLKRFAKSVKLNYAVMRDDEKATEVGKFIDLLNGIFPHLCNDAI